MLARREREIEETILGTKFLIANFFPVAANGDTQLFPFLFNAYVIQYEIAARVGWKFLLSQGGIERRARQAKVKKGEYENFVTRFTKGQFFIHTAKKLGNRTLSFRLKSFSEYY